MVECRLEEQNNCQADIVLMSEELANATYSDLFPINALRNVALLAARTELVVIGDGDPHPLLIAQTPYGTCCNTLFKRASSTSSKNVTCTLAKANP